MKKVLVILGPTATGKTDVALDLAKKFNGELVSCDSRQVYKGLDIGTGKLPGVEVEYEKHNGYWVFDGIKVWMTDVTDPKLRFTVKDYKERAEKILEDIFERGKLPIIVGGTGLYLKALLEGLPNLVVPVDENLRRELQSLSKTELQKKLQSLSPATFENLNDSDRQNPRRLLRSIELVSMYGYVDKSQIVDRKSQKLDILKIGLTTSREVLKKRIFDRLLKRIDQGLIEESKHLHKNGLSFKRMKELGLEYGILADLLRNKITRDEFISILSTQINQYAKRQITWFKKEKNVDWFDITEKNYAQKVEKRVKNWYHTVDDKKS